ncbi:MAG: double-strand break repair helicase AddA [Erythrobacter sp.]
MGDPPDRAGDASMSGLVFPLAGEQLPAAGPQDNVWLSASAGTGKTQVLSARVLRLLLASDVDPSQILCLTFTKAGAAEMANRINAVLARWVRLPPALLARELGYLGADIGPETQQRARTLFASVLDCPGGGLRIDTIHAFSQWLLANFPEEAGLVPGARAMEDRTRTLLAREVLAAMLGEAEAAGDARITGAVERFTRRKEPGALLRWLMTCAEAGDMWEGAGSWQSPMDARVRRLLGIPADADAGWANAGLAPGVFPDATLRAMMPALEAWRTATADKALEFLRGWLMLDHAARVEAAQGFKGTLLKVDGTPALSLKKPRESDPGFAPGQDTIAEALAEVEARRALLALAGYLADAFEIGGAFAQRWAAAKAREGLLDFSDLIRKAARLLGREDASAWIRYKLDRNFDHILIDEAQDTNQAQWDIVLALIDDFFSGEGARGDRLRTIFTVGDYKQAIFGFQGTSPENFARAKGIVERRILDARANIEAGRINRRAPAWRPLELDQSFRTAQPVLDFVNEAIGGLGHAAFGLDAPPRPHIGYRGAGLVTLWEPVVPGDNAADDEDMPADDGAGAQDWLPHHDTLLASRIADQIERWVSRADPFVLAKGGAPRHAGAGDIMVLVRRRKELAGQIVGKLQARGVPVAGVDRLRLGAPLAVKDVLAALRFAAQPLDDLSLANLLASPLMGWTQDDLLAHVPRARDARLWEHLRTGEAPAPLVAETADKLRDLLRRADYETPQALIAWLLAGPWQGRARLVARLGAQANDPLDELLNTAFAYEREFVPSLAGFLHWFDAGEVELKRDSDGGAGQVRVLTVHGSKGLQAPIVILADATGEPGDPHNLELADDPLGEGDSAAQATRKVPLPPLTKSDHHGPIAAAAEAARIAGMQEHWRLMYVAMTRAEEALFIGGSLGKKQRDKGAPEDSWYAQLAPLFTSDQLADPVWGMRRERGSRAAPPVEAEGGEGAAAIGAEPDLPAWMNTPIGPEPRPPRPLAPSSAGEDRAADPPLPPDAARGAARRGSLIHRLLERLPDLPAAERAEAARLWLARQAGDLPEDARAEMLGHALGVLDHPDFAAIFGPDALAEVPLAAIIGGVVVSGTADRLLVTADEVVVVDFKTTRRPPGDAAAIPPATLRQMAAYVAALEAIYPRRRVRAAVLYTHAPQLFEVTPAMIDHHKQQLDAPQESFMLPDIE